MIYVLAFYTVLGEVGALLDMALRDAIGGAARSNGVTARLLVEPPGHNCRDWTARIRMRN